VVLEVQLPAALRGAERLQSIVRGLRPKAGLSWLAAAGTGAVVRCKVDRVPNIDSTLSSKEIESK
jgi:hypothetical protein